MWWILLLFLTMCSLSKRCTSIPFAMWLPVPSNRQNIFSMSLLSLAMWLYLCNSRNSPPSSAWISEWEKSGAELNRVAATLRPVSEKCMLIVTNYFWTLGLFFSHNQSWLIHRIYYEMIMYYNGPCGYVMAANHRTACLL